jgi:hypothetical protein
MINKQVHGNFYETEMFLLFIQNLIFGLQLGHDELKQFFFTPYPLPPTGIL